jgi:hypothetical protein
MLETRIISLCMADGAEMNHYKLVAAFVTIIAEQTTTQHFGWGICVYFAQTIAAFVVI